jgi:serine/threonine protein kinase
MGVPDGLRDALADRYTLERELGCGGTAMVYLAQDLHHDRSVALKLFPPSSPPASAPAPAHPDGPRLG